MAYYDQHASTDITKIEHPRLTWLMLRAIAFADNPCIESALAVQSYPQLKEQTLEDMKDPHPLALASGVAEMFAYNLAQTKILKAASLRVPKLELWSEGRRRSYAKSDTNDQGKFFRQVPGGWAVSQKVHRALPLYHLLEDDWQEKMGVGWKMFEDWFQVKSFVWGNRSEGTIERYQEVEAAISEEGVAGYVDAFINKTCPVIRTQYADFTPAMERDEKVIAAAKWDSDQRLLAHAFRAFLYASYGHSSNCLVDSTGQLWQIDFEKIIVHSNSVEDFAMLRHLVEGSDKVMRACRIISQLTPQDIEQALSGISERYWQGGAYSHSEIAALVFANRLEAWRSIFGES